MAFSQVEFNRWVSDHGPVLYRLAYRMIGDRHDAEDIVQDTFRSAWNSRQRFEAGRGERAWLTSILRRRVIDRWRRGGAQNALTPGGQTYSGQTYNGALEVGVAADDPLADDYTDEMQQALDCLAADLRETLLLVVVGELTHQEAADLLGLPLGTVLSRVSRARGKLRDALLANDSFHAPRRLGHDD